MRSFFVIVLMAFFGGPTFAQHVSLNSGWQFVRLGSPTAGAWKSGQQGSDWESQFNVQHVGNVGQESSLALNDSLLISEQRQIADARWERVMLPHTAYVEPLVILEPWQGVCYYRREITIGRRQDGKQLWIEFEGAMQLADVWINGRHVTQHAGGYTSFVIDATEFMHMGDNELVVRLDNRDNGLIPPGKPLGSLDFCYHSGIYRDVTLICKPRVSITHPLMSGKVAGGGVFVTYPEVSSQRAIVKVKTEIGNTTTTEGSFSLRQSLYEWKRSGGLGRRVAVAEVPFQLDGHSTQDVTMQLQVDNPKLWNVDAPNLYVLRTDVMDGHRVVDSESTRIGIRHFEVTSQGCFVNGKHVELDGANRHQDYPYVGNALSDHAHYRDIWQMRAYGFNTVRLGHYPQDPAVLDACDELGMLAIEPIPGWQYFSRDPLFTALTYDNVREMVRRDRNHPCVLLWETTLNESWPPTEWKDGAVRTAHEEMPEGQCFTAGDSYGYSGFDVCYNDWDNNHFSRPNNSGKPGFIREYYDYEFGGHYSTSRITLGDGERALRQNLWNLQWSLNSNRNRSQSTMGGAVWSMYDYNRGCCDNICYSGLADLFRRPKYSLNLFRTQIPAGCYTPDGTMPYELFVASRWDSKSSDTLMVLGNVAEVALFVNGTEVARQKADNGPTTQYTPSPDQGNCNRLQFPPFTFTGIKFEAGSLKAVGYDSSGNVVAQRSVMTPGMPSQVGISYFQGGKPAAKEDVLIVYVTIADDEGVPCHDNGVPVVIAVEGGEVMGPSETLTEDGVASFVVRTGSVSTLKIQARALGTVARKSFRLDE